MSKGETSRATPTALAIAEAYESLERRRKLYTSLGLILVLATLAAGLRLTEAANAGDFLTGLPNFLDYPNDLWVGARAFGEEFLSFDEPGSEALLQALTALFFALRVGLLIWLAALFYRGIATLLLDDPREGALRPLGLAADAILSVPALLLVVALPFAINGFGVLAFVTTIVLLAPKYFPYLIETINMALVATLFGFFFAFLISFVASRNLVKNRALVWTARRLMDLSRAFPEIVIALFLIFIIGKNPLAAVAAIAFHTVGALGKLFSEVNENADMRPLEGLEASGANWIQRIWFGLVPQVLPNFLSYSLLRLEINVRASAIMGFVGAGGLGQQFKTVTDWKYGHDMSAILVLLIAAIFLIDWISSRLRQRIIAGGAATELQGVAADHSVTPGGVRALWLAAIAVMAVLFFAVADAIVLDAGSLTGAALLDAPGALFAMVLGDVRIVFFAILALLALALLGWGARNRLGAPPATPVSPQFAGLLNPNPTARTIGLGAAAVIAAYCVYLYDAFEVQKANERARMDRVQLLALDVYAHKIHSVYDVRRPEKGLAVTLENNRYQTYDPLPDWIDAQGARYAIDLGENGAIEIEPGLLTITRSDGATARVKIGDGAKLTPEVLSASAPYLKIVDEEAPVLDDAGAPIRNADGEVETRKRRRYLEIDGSGVTEFAEQPRPPWLQQDARKVEIRLGLYARATVTGTKVEVLRYFSGWENFWFDFGHPLNGASLGEVWRAGFLEAPISADQPADQSNWSYIRSSFLNNQDWQHGEVYEAIGLTVLMALLGTMLASIFGLPLAFVAARNVNPIGPLRVAVKKFLDFLRAVDMLIWSLVFIRAFGQGPLSGVLAIFFTDTGTLGKLYSEAIENADKRQVEGIQATGAGAIQRNWFGIFPQILPVFVSQALYFLESNTRSATIIGILGAGGIGLKLADAMRTTQDWENVMYMIVLIILVVIAMDNVSGWARKRLIQGGGVELDALTQGRRPSMWTRREAARTS